MDEQNIPQEQRLHPEVERARNFMYEVFTIEEHRARVFSLLSVMDPNLIMEFHAQLSENIAKQHELENAE